jgi:hypothetical protein
MYKLSPYQAYLGCGRWALTTTSYFCHMSFPRRQVLGAPLILLLAICISSLSTDEVVADATEKETCADGNNDWAFNVTFVNNHGKDISVISTGDWEEKARVVTGGSVNLPTSMGEVFVFSENAKGRQPFHQFMVEHSGVTTFVASRSASMQDRCHRYPQQPAIEAGTMSGVFEALSEPGAPYKPEVLSRDPWVVYFHEVGDTRVAHSRDSPPVTH